MVNQTASVSVGFNYQGEAVALENTQDDAKFYISQFSANASTWSFVTDARVKGKGKDAFLKYLKQKMSNKKNIIFSYAGHGLIDAEGNWAMLLPGMPDRYINECPTTVGILDSPSDPVARGLTNTDVIPSRQQRLNSVPASEKGCYQKISPYLVSDQDLKKVFAGKNVLFFNDSCYSGAADFGKNVTTVSAALANEKSFDSTPYQAAMLDKHYRRPLLRSGKSRKADTRPKSERLIYEQGAFTSTMKRSKQRCDLDGDNNGTITAAELIARFPYGSKNTTTKTRKVQPKSAVVFSNNEEYEQNMITQNYNSWLKCLDLFKTSCEAVESNSGTESQSSEQ